MYRKKRNKTRIKCLPMLLTAGHVLQTVSRVFVWSGSIVTQHSQSNCLGNTEHTAAWTSQSVDGEWALIRVIYWVYDSSIPHFVLFQWYLSAPSQLLPLHLLPVVHMWTIQAKHLLYNVLTSCFFSGLALSSLLVQTSSRWSLDNLLYNISWKNTHIGNPW